MNKQEAHIFRAYSYSFERVNARVIQILFKRVKYAEPRFIIIYMRILRVLLSREYLFIYFSIIAHSRTV